MDNFFFCEFIITLFIYSTCSAEVYLQLDSSGERIPSHSIISPNTVSEINGIRCCGNESGTWFYPNGSVVPPRGNLLIGVRRQPCLELQLEEKFLYSHMNTQDEGVYTCNTKDLSRSLQMLYVGLYTIESYENSAGPVLSSVEPVVFEVTSEPGVYPPSLSVNCPTTSYPPTHTSWLLNGAQVNTSLSQVIRDPVTTAYDNILTINDISLTGSVTFICTVSNSKGSASATRTLLAPSGPVTGLSTEKPGGNRVTVRWTPPQDVLRYTVFLNGEVSEVVSDPMTTSVTLTELTAGVQYEVTVQAFGDLPGPVSTSSLVTLAAVPAPTINSISAVSSTSIRVAWTITVQQSAVSGFRVSYTPSDGQCTTIESGRQAVEGGAVTEHLLTGLQEGVNYEISVQARGVEAYGDLSSLMLGTTQDAVPSAPPTNVTATPQVSPELGITVSWGPPPCEHINSRTGLTGYTVRYRPLNNGAWVSPGDPGTLTTTITGVTELVVYEIQVAARNGAGVGVYSSSVTASVVAETPPGAVTVLRVTPGITSLSVSWEPPVEGEGRGLITVYRVCYRPSGVSFTNCFFETQSVFQFTDLHPDSGYVVTVRARIGFLEGPEEGQSVTTDPIGQVTGVRVSVSGADSVSVSWTRLDSLDIHQYQVSYSAGGGKKRKRKRQSRTVFVDNNTTSIVITSLENRAFYSFQVSAIVLVNNVEFLGEPSALTPESTVMLSDTVSNAAIAGIVVMMLVLIILIVVGLLAVSYYVRRSRKSGGYDVTVRSTSMELVKTSSRAPSRLPLPNFEKPQLEHTKPVILSHPKDTIAVEGEAVLFSPQVTGTPVPTIAWFHEGHILSPNYAIEIGEDGSLQFVSVETKHAGVYRFTVSNSAGSVQGQVTLFVRGDGNMVDGDVNGPPLVTSNCVPLEDFGEYIEQLHQNNNRGFRNQYYSLANGEEGHETWQALNPQNKHLNRFTNIVAYDDNRVRVFSLPGPLGALNEYINASPIDGYNTPKKYIATQGPTDRTLADFWGMVVQTHAQMIIMITNLKEGTRFKCTQYWPKSKGQSSEYGPFTVTMLEEKEYADFSVRMFEVMVMDRVQSTIRITQFHYTSWPDHGVPDYVGPMLAFHRKITTEYRPTKGPIIVHCSAGVGRTGTYIAMDIALEQAEQENSINIPAIVTNLRIQRMKLVQTDEQYTFLHDAVFESLMCGSTQIPVWELTTTMARLAQVSPHTRKSGYQHQFEILAKVTPKIGSYSVSSAVQYPDKNRQMDHLPPEKYRVILKAEYPDYIHASFLNGYRKKRSFIVTQCPLERTCRDFWKMVYERNCTSIVMLSGLEEDGMEVCYRYWPESGSSQYGEYVVGAIQQSHSNGYSERVLGVTDSKSGQTHRVSQFQLSCWDTVGAPSALPSQQSSLLSVIDAVLTLQNKYEEGPIVLHCGDTVGRCCVFCAVAILTESFRAEGLVDIFQVVKALRVQKPGAIPTVEQYEYIHNSLLTFLDSDNRSFGHFTI